MRTAMQLYGGLMVMCDKRRALENRNRQAAQRIHGLHSESERSIRDAETAKKQKAEDLLVSFLLSFASRTVTRERLNLFTTNYDRVIEYGCDLAGLHVLDRFIRALALCSRDPAKHRHTLQSTWNTRRAALSGGRYSPLQSPRLGRLAMGGEGTSVLRRPVWRCCSHPDIPKEPSGSVMIYPNPAKDVETLDYPYAELFRDFAAAVCRPNSSVVTYGYGFGDDHVNRVIRDMLTIPSTHLVIIAWDKTNPSTPDAPANASRQRIAKFCQEVGKCAEISVLLGSHFGDLETLVQNYLPKPAIDQITIRKTNLEEQRGEGYKKSNGRRT